MADTAYTHHTWTPPQQPASADDIVVQVADILFEYLAPHSGIAPAEAARRVTWAVDSPAGLAAYAADAMRPMQTDANDVVVQLVDVLDRPAPHPKELVSRLLEVIESPLAVEVYDREMQRRQPRDADHWN